MSVTLRCHNGVGVLTEARLLPYLAINSGVSASLTADDDQHDETRFGSNPATSVRPGTVITPYAGVIVPLLPNRVVGEILYPHDFIGDETDAFPGGTVGR